MLPRDNKLEDPEADRLIANLPRRRTDAWREVRWYDLRHAGANEMREAGVPMRYIRAMLNHSDLRIAGYYARWTKRQKSTAVSNRVAKMRTIAADAEFRRAEA